MQRLASNVIQLGELLLRDQPLWRPRPFMDPAVGWRQTHPRIYRWLLELATDRIDAIDRSMVWPEDAPSQLRSLSDNITALTTALLPALPSDAPKASRRLLWRVPGHKWNQIEALGGVAAALLGRPRKPVKKIVDWCAGKGHLGRLVAHSGHIPVVHIEMRRDLCDVGLGLAERAGMTELTQFLSSDVLVDAQALEALTADCLAIALHACGALSTTLSRAAAVRRVPAVLVSTCCYHKLAPGNERYQALSQIGQGAALELDRGALRLPTADEGRAGLARRKRRRRELAWRQGLQELISEATGDPTYVPLGALPRAHLNKSFERFCRDVADLLALPLPGQWSPTRTEEAGWERARRARALALLRGMYRRPMEAWLIGDQALAFQERGYSVRVGTFCDRRITPRNLALAAWLQ